MFGTRGVGAALEGSVPRHLYLLWGGKPVPRVDIAMTITERAGRPRSLEIARPTRNYDRSGKVLYNVVSPVCLPVNSKITPPEGG